MRQFDYPTCSTCKAWDQRYPQNKELGVCLRMGAFQASRDELAVHVNQNMDAGHVASDFAAVRTRADFGCREHSELL